MRRFTSHEWIYIILCVLITISIAFTAYDMFGPPRRVEFSTPNVTYNGVEQVCVKNDTQSDSNTSAWDCSPKKAA